MSNADEIRSYVLENHISPARLEGRREITIRAGDIHREMGLVSRMPAVCSALETPKFGELANVNLIGRRGPHRGANVLFTFSLDTSVRPKQPSGTRVNAKPTASVATSLDLRRSLVLVSCVKSKLANPAPARALYVSEWFSKVRALVEGQEAKWLILSALHGLVDPAQEIEPYEYSLNTARVAERRAWAASVLEDLLPETEGFERVVFFAGLRYREMLEGSLKARGLEVVTPMEGLRLGEQLAWLSSQA